MTTLAAPSSPPKRAVTHRIANEQYDALACWLQSTAVSGTAGCKTIGVTSCERGVGVSSVARNLAIAAAHNSDLPVLLIDASGASLNHVAQPPQAASQDEEFASGSCFEEFVTRSAIANLSLLSMDSMRGASSGPLTGRLVTEALHELHSEFGIIVLDLPPADTGLCFAVGGTLDGVLLVVEAGRTNGDLAIRAKKRLLQANADVLGIILNRYSQG